MQTPPACSLRVATSSVNNRNSPTNSPTPAYFSVSDFLLLKGVSIAAAMDGARTNSPHFALLSLALFSLFLAPSLAQTCASYSFSGNRVYTSCVDLPVLSSYLHWNFSEASYVADIAFRASGVTSSNWVSWAINPSGLQMVGSQALIAYQNSNGSMRAYTSLVDSLQPTLSQGNLTFGVPNITAEFLNSGEMTIFATLQLNSGMTTVNQVWQVGPMESGSPASHTTSGANLQSVGTLNFLTGTSVGSGGSGSSRQRRRNVSGPLTSETSFSIISSIPWKLFGNHNHLHER